MAHRVRFDRDAEADLNRLYEWIRGQSGSAAVAQGYIRRIVASCMGLHDFPERGTKRDDIRPGLRTLGFERRATIAFLVEDRRVTILRVLYGGRSTTALGRQRTV